MMFSAVLAIPLVIGAETERTWLGWASGFIGVLAVLGVLYVLAAWLRRKRDS